MDNLNWPADSRPEPLTVASNSYLLAFEMQQLAAEGEQGFDTDEGLAEWNARLDAHLSTVGDKIARCVAIVRRAEIEEALAKAEAKRWTAAAKRHAALAENVTARLKALLEAQRLVTCDGMAIVGAGWVKLANSVSKSVFCPDPLKLPLEFQRITVEADKKAIGDAIKGGAVVAGATIVTTTEEVVKFGK